jgi:hypothetical protein
LKQKEIGRRERQLIKERRSFVGHIRDKFKDELTLFSMETAGYLGLRNRLKSEV